jgi:non-specific serine/threonine protein kinase
LLAAHEGRHDEAVALLTEAERRCATAGLISFQARILVDLATTLSHRSERDDAERSRLLASKAGLLAERHALVETARRAETLRGAEAHPPAPAEVSGGARVVSFVRDGDVWQIGHDPTFRLRHSKGLGYLEQLLRTPGREHHVLDLTSGAASDASTVRIKPADPDVGWQDAAGAIPEAGLDDEARRSYQLRLRELRREVELADASNESARGEQARSEIELLTRELAGAYGIGGRARPSHSAAERARQSVTKALRTAIVRVGQEQAELGAHLERALLTGVYCSYDPDPSSRLIWRFA